MSQLLILVVKDDPSIVAGLSIGADDYIDKPFGPRKLLARIEVTLRRTRSLSPVIALGPVSIDTESTVVAKDREEIQLSMLGYKLLLLFASNKGNLIIRERMREVLWDDGAPMSRTTPSPYA